MWVLIYETFSFTNIWHRAWLSCRMWGWMFYFHWPQKNCFLASLELSWPGTQINSHKHWKHCYSVAGTVLEYSVGTAGCFMSQLEDSWNQWDQFVTGKRISLETSLPLESGAQSVRPIFCQQIFWSLHNQMGWLENNLSQDLRSSQSHQPMWPWTPVLSTWAQDLMLYRSTCLSLFSRLDSGISCERSVLPVSQTAC